MPRKNVSNDGWTNRRRRQQRRPDLLAGWTRIVYCAGYGYRGYGLRYATGRTIILQETTIP